MIRGPAIGVVAVGCVAVSWGAASAADHAPAGTSASDRSEAGRFAAGRWLDLTHPFDAATADDFVAWEAEHRRQFVAVIVLVRTGWSKRWGDRAAYLGTDVKGPEAVPRLRFPGLSPQGAKWLVEHRRVKAVGIDTASIDHGPSTRFGSHVVLCQADTPIFENLDGLEKLPAEGAFVAALPMKIAGGSGGPLRVLARLPDGK